MNIALLSIHSCPLGRPGSKDTGGMNVYVRELAVRLGNREHRVDVFTHLHDTEEPEVAELAGNARLVHLKGGGKSVDKYKLYDYLPEIAANLKNYKKRENLDYDVIYSHYWISGEVGRLVDERWHIPHLIMFHTLGMVKNSLGIGESEPQLRIDSERRLVQECDCLIAATEREKETLAAMYGASADKTTVIPCGVNLDLFKPVNRAEARLRLGMGSGKIILFAGRIEKIKGLDRLIEAVGLMYQIPDLKLFIVGGDESNRGEIDRLKGIALGFGVSDRVEFRGSVPQESLPAYYSAADVFVLPSYYESFGMAALEALACGTPVVSTPVGDWENIIQPGINGYTVPDNSPPHLAEKLSLALIKPDFASPDSIHSSVLRFSWDAITEQTLKICKKLKHVESEKAHEKC